MCGISGLYNFSRLVGELGVQASIVQQMTNRIAHRGPDADGLHNSIDPVSLEPSPS